MKTIDACGKLIRIPRQGLSAGRLIDGLAVLVLGIIFMAIFQITPAHAQLQALNRGDRVKIFVSSKPKTAHIGIVGGINSTELILLKKDVTLFIPQSTIQGIAVRSDRKNKNKTRNGALIGAATAGLVLALIPKSEYQYSESCEDSNVCKGIFKGALSLASLFSGAAIVLAGGGLGAIIGSSFPNYRWEKLPMEVSLDLPNPGKNPNRIHPGFTVNLSF